MKSIVEIRKNDIIICCKEAKSGREYPYEGPAVFVNWNDDFVYISNGSGEDTAMFNIEALPAVRRALGVVTKQIKSAQSKK